MHCLGQQADLLKAARAREQQRIGTARLRQPEQLRADLPGGDGDLQLPGQDEDELNVRRQRVGLVPAAAARLDVAEDGLQSLLAGRRAGDRPAYVSVDIDVLDPAHAPGTGTPEAGGLSSRELLAALRSFARLNLIGADIVEVAPAYDYRGSGNTQMTSASRVVEPGLAAVRLRPFKAGHCAPRRQLEVRCRAH